MDIETLKLCVNRLDSDFDEQKSETIFVSAKYFSRASFKEFYRTLRRSYVASYYGRCGHEWDCCGCAYIEHNNIEFNSKHTRVVTSIGLNY